MKILMVTTSASLMPPDHSTGLWLEEFAVPYDAFLVAGAAITVASPQGGPVPLDPKTDPSDRERIKWHGALLALENAARLDAIDDAEFDGIFIPGGHGPVMDLVENARLQQLISNFEEDGKFIGAICHGPAALLNVRVSSGHYLLRDRRVTGFSNLEERLVGLHGKVPFLLEDEIKARGAKYDAALIPMTSHVIRDGNLVTGQNPASSHRIAEEFVHGLQRNIEIFDQMGLRSSTSPGVERREMPRPALWSGY